MGDLPCVPVRATVWPARCTLHAALIPSTVYCTGKLDDYCSHRRDARRRRASLYLAAQPPGAWWHAAHGEMNQSSFVKIFKFDSTARPGPARAYRVRRLTPHRHRQFPFPFPRVTLQGSSRHTACGRRSGFWRMLVTLRVFLSESSYRLHLF